MSDFKFHFVTTESNYANALRNELILHYGYHPPFEASHIIAIGGDGTALRAWHCSLQLNQQSRKKVPVYAVDCSDRIGHQGFLTNPKLSSILSLGARVREAEPMEIYPLQAECTPAKSEPRRPFSGVQETLFGFNEIAVKAAGYGTTMLNVGVCPPDGGKTDAFSLTGDGVLVATPVGASAYYKSAGGRTLSGFGPVFRPMLRTYDAYPQNLLGIQTICVTPGYNAVIADTHAVVVAVREAAFRETRVMSDNGFASKPVEAVRICKSRLPAVVLRDKERC